jgi:hypothetical protein
MMTPDDLDDTPEAQALNAEHCRKIEAAAAAPGFSGDLRRAINAALIPTHRLAAMCGVEPERLELFRAGDAELPTGVVDRLAEVLHLALTPA